MDNQTAQAFADFERFLMGQSAPALVGHALATVVRQDMRVVAQVVVRRAYSTSQQDRLAVLLAVRNKVYDIFFYRIVRFRRIYEFFPRFERAIIEVAPEGDRDAIAALFKRYPWQEIRPIGDIRDPRELALENRPDASVSADRFNEELYRNATHQILSAERRFQFSDNALQQNVAQSQAQVSEVFDDFVGLIKDAILRREIMLANVADRDTVYKHQTQFQIESYMSQLADLGIALINDDFLEHGVQIFEVIQTLAVSTGLDMSQLRRLHAKSELLNTAKIVDYSANRTGPLLLRSVLSIFPEWRPQVLLDRLRTEGKQNERNIALTILEAYGRDVYPLIVDALERCDASVPWYFKRNLAYLLGRLVTDQPALRSRACQALAGHLRKDGVQQVNAEIVTALGAIHNDQAVTALVGRLAQFTPDFGKTPESTDVVNRILAALIDIQTEPSLKAAVEFCDSHGLLEQYHEQLSRIALPESIRTAFETAIRKELRKLKMSFSLFGDARAVRGRLLALGSAEVPDVGALCDEVQAGLPADHEIAQVAARLRDIPAPPPPLGYDRAFHGLIQQGNLAEALSYAFESGIGGCLEISTRGGIQCQVSLRNGEVWHASAPSLFSNDLDAFFWIFALDRTTIGTLRFDPSRVPTDPRTLEPATPRLIREGLFRAKHVQQTIGSILSPESRFRRRQPSLPDKGFQTTGQLGPYQAVWACIANFVDLKTISDATQLSEHEIYRVLFDLLRQNLLEVETGGVDRQLATIDDALTALGLFLRRIEQNPTFFQSYQSGSEVCAYLSNEARDETIRSVAWALHTFLQRAYTLRQVLTPQKVDFCNRVLGLVSVYLRSGSDSDRRELLDFLDIYLPEEDRWPEPAQDEDAFIKSLLEQIENIDALNDPFDEMPDLRNADAGREIVDTLDEALAGTLGGDDGIGDIRSPRELLGESANEYAKPIRDFVREVERNLEAHRETPSAWLGLVQSPLELLVVAADRAGETDVRDCAARLDRAFKQQRQTESDVLTPAFCGYVLTEYRHLAELLPATFATTLPNEDVAAKKETLLVKFLLRQVPEVDDRVVNRVLLAGFNKFADVAETPPDELSRAVGISRGLADKIFMKIYQYEDLYHHGDEPQAHAKLLAYYAISLNVLKEIHGSIGRLAQQPAAGRERKEQLMSDRQRALWGLFALLCLRNEIDLIEKLQKTVFEQRIKMLEDYFAELSAEPFPARRARK